jgi:DNA-binding NtrC family response regulator
VNFISYDQTSGNGEMVSHTGSDTHRDESDLLNVKVARFERALIREALDATGWVKLRAARKLGIPEATLRGKMKKYGLEKPTKQH